MSDAVRPRLCQVVLDSTDARRSAEFSQASWRPYTNGFWLSRSACSSSTDPALLTPRQ